MTKYPDIFASLAAPFFDDEIKSFSAAGGKSLRYVTARTVMNRLDEIIGPENWSDDYSPGENSVLCRLTIRLPDGLSVTKADAGGYAGMPNSGDDDKSGYSDSFKRAAVKFGVGRFLYGDGVPDYSRDSAISARYALIPAAPLVKPPPPAAVAPAAPLVNPPPPPRTDGLRSYEYPQAAPRSGRALFAWIREQEQRYGISLLLHVNAFGKINGYPAKVIEWNPKMVSLAHSECVRKIASFHSGQSEET